MISYVARVIELIQAEFGSDVAGIAPPPVPSNAAYPYVTVTQIMTTDTESHDGDSALDRSIIQINVYHKTYEKAWALRRAIKLMLRQSVPNNNDVALRGVNHNQDNELHDGNPALHQLITRWFMWWDTSVEVSGS